MAWLSGWDYRKSITLSRVSGAVTNYQMKLLVGESSGAAGEDVDCDSKVASDFDDLRFTTSDGETLLDYWIESLSGVTPNQLATVWIEFDSIGTTDTTFYMYYGNSGAAAYSSGTNTFIVFDDFERGSNGDAVGGIWTVLAGSIVISTEQAYSGTRSAKMVGQNTITPGFNTALNASANISIRFRTYKEDQADLGIMHGDGTTRAIIRAEADEDMSVFDGVTYQDTGSNITAAAWQLIELNEWDWTNKTVDVWLNGLKIKDNGDISYTNSSIANLLYFIQYTATTGVDAWIDEVLVRNWRATEPAWGSWGVEETSLPYPTVLPAAPTVMSGGEPIPSDQWNTYAVSGLHAVQTKIGVDSSAVATTMDYLLKNTSSLNPGHRHNIVYASDGTTVCVSGGADAQTMAFSGIKYIFPSTQGASGSTFINDGAGTLTSQARCVIVRKTSDTSTASDTTVNNDPHLRFNVAANSVWEVVLYLLWTAGTTGDIKYGWSLTGGGEIFWNDEQSGRGQYTGPQGAKTTADVATCQGNGAATLNFTIINAQIHQGGSDGVAQFQWAQNTSNATNTTIYTNSTMVCYWII